MIPVNWPIICVILLMLWEINWAPDSHSDYINTLQIIDWPAKLCNVVPPMWHAATPVLAVAKVLFGGRDPMILLSKKDFPVPENTTEQYLHQAVLMKMSQDGFYKQDAACNLAEQSGKTSSFSVSSLWSFIFVHFLPALPVKKTFLPLSTALRTAACSLLSLRDGKERIGFLLGLAFTWNNDNICCHRCLSVTHSVNRENVFRTPVPPVGNSPAVCCEATWM